MRSLSTEAYHLGFNKPFSYLLAWVQFGGRHGGRVPPLFETGVT